MRKVWSITAARVGVGFLDLLGVFLLSQFSSAALQNGNSVSSLVPFTDSWRMSPLTALGLALVALSTKSVMSYFLNIKLVKLLNKRCSEIIDNRSSAIADTDKEILDRSTSQNLHYTVTAGMRAGTVGVVGPLSTLISEGSLLLFFSVFLLATNVVAAALTMFILGVTSRQLHRYLSERQYRNGQLVGSANIHSLSTFQESMYGYKELLVRGNLKKSLHRFSAVESGLSELQTRQIALGTLPRHVLETVVMLSLGLIATTSLLFGDAESAILLLTLFGAATARILPSLIPLQASLSEIQVNLGRAFELDKVLILGGKSLALRETMMNPRAAGNQNVLTFKSVSYRYPGAEQNALNEISFEFSGEGWFAIDGPSGSGKSTIFDILMGIRSPSTGSALINEQNPWNFVNQNAGYCAYLPQRISVSNNTIAENVAYGLHLDAIDLELVQKVMSSVGLEQIVQRSGLGLLEPIGELGSSVSGGQLQRLGIARCLYTNPSIILLDESTSGLDRETQSSILDLIEKLATKITVISISHDVNITQRASEVLRILDGRQVGERNK
jgi:ABC-type transport system involved in cytochrome bd biosynthesis fused ATPase/permease subunit